MTLHNSTTQYLKPTDAQLDQMQAVREASKVYADALSNALPDGPDKTYLMRKLREVAMWANVTIMCLADGSPRT